MNKHTSERAHISERTYEKTEHIRASEHPRDFAAIFFGGVGGSKVPPACINALLDEQRYSDQRPVFLFFCMMRLEAHY